MAQRFRAMAAVAAVFLGAGGAQADVWDAPPPFTGPDDFSCAATIVELVHGVRQVHDLIGVDLFPDIDWARVQQRAHRSYEVRLTNSQMLLAQGAASARRACDGTLLTAGRPYEGSARDAISIPWVSTGDGPTFIKTAAGLQGTEARYEIQLLETTYAVPRYNNSATQQTILIVQNTRARAVEGVISFFSVAGGAPIHVRPIALPPRGMLLLNTSTVAALAGTSGSALVAHDGGYGALSGKAVALEPGTGFTFDTPIVAKPY
jgi:hypothetical protein